MPGLHFDTIVAPATGRGRSAIAVVRLDGPAAAEIASKLSGISELRPRRATVSLLRNGAEPLDEAVLTFYQAPASYTGNDVVELSVHGSDSVVSRLIAVCVGMGARVAEPGEFTERAVLNGRMDLTQAEGVAALIDSRTALQARLALGHVQGELSRAATELREALLFLMSRLEGALDFADEGYEFITREQAASMVDGVRRSIERMLGTFDRGRAIREGVTLVILGQPNAGKSTLLNALVGSDRAIVTAVPGTTRDLLRETIELGGLPVTMVDTAGLRKTEDLVEGIGIERAREVAASADLVLYLVDSVEGMRESDELEISVLRDPLVVWSKADLAAPPAGALAISAARGGGLDILLKRLEQLVLERWGLDAREAVIVNERQRGALALALEAIEAAGESLRNGAGEEVVLVDLYRASGQLGSLIGALGADEVLGEVFSRFCIGK